MLSNRGAKFVHIFQAGYFLWYTERFRIITHAVFSFCLNDRCEFYMSNLLPRYSTQSVNPDCSISIIHGGRLGKAFIMFSDTVNIIWIFASVKCVNGISPAAVGKGTSGPLLFVRPTLSAEKIYFWILKVLLMGWKEGDFWSIHSIWHPTVLVHLFIYVPFI